MYPFVKHLDGKRFFVYFLIHQFDPTTWHQWNEERRKDHVKQFLSLNPRASDHYTKPMNSGKKPSGNGRKRPVTEPIIIEERVKSTTDNVAVTPLVVTKKKDWEYQCSKVVPVDLTKLDPKRKETDKMILLRLKSQHKAVTRTNIFTFFSK